MSSATDLSSLQAMARALIERLAARSELSSAVVLSITSLLTSWSGYQAALWDGDQAAAYSQAGAERTEASRLSVQAGQLEGVDILMYTRWLEARGSGDAPLEAFYLQRFRPEYRVAHDAWQATRPLTNPAAPPTPFDMPEYRVAVRARAESGETRADALFQKSEAANQISDEFVRATVILASALFFAGIGQAFRANYLRVTMLAIATLHCLWGVVVLWTLPFN